MTAWKTRTCQSILTGVVALTGVMPALGAVSRAVHVAVVDAKGRLLPEAVLYVAGAPVDPEAKAFVDDNRAVSNGDGTWSVKDVGTKLSFVVGEIRFGTQYGQLSIPQTSDINIVVYLSLDEAAAIVTKRDWSLADALPPLNGTAAIQTELLRLVPEPLHAINTTPRQTGNTKTTPPPIAALWCMSPAA